VCMCVYVCVCVCMCMYVYVCVCMCMYVYVCVCMCMYVCMYACMHACMYIYYIASKCHASVHKIPPARPFYISHVILIQKFLYLERNKFLKNMFQKFSKIFQKLLKIHISENYQNLYFTKNETYFFK